MQSPTLLRFFTKLLPTSLVSWVYELAKNELSKRKKLLDFDKEESEKGLIWFEYRNFDITLCNFLDDRDDGKLWSISQNFENLFYYKTASTYSVAEAVQDAEEWVDNYIQARSEVFRASHLPKEKEKNSFLYRYRNFKILCLSSGKAGGSISWYVYDKENNFIMQSWEKKFTVDKARDAGYEWIQNYISKGMLKDGTVACNQQSG